MRIVLAFDIEKAGPSASDHILGLGMSVVNQDLKEVDSLFLPCYVPSKMEFDERCWDEFWSKHPDQLSALNYNGLLTVHERGHDVVQKFQEFRAKWENYAKENDIEYYFVSDTNVFDAEGINQLLFRHLPDESPIPYASSTGKYEDFINVSDYQRGVLSIIDPTFNDWWGMSSKMEELFEVPPKEREHDHNPVNDAYTIAYDFQVLMGIKSRTVNLKQMPTQQLKRKKQDTHDSSTITSYLATAAMVIGVGLIISMVFRRR